MTRHNDKVSMRQMLDQARRAQEMAHGRKRADLESHDMLELALTRLVEIIGEAAARVSPSTREKCSEIPWLAIVGMRNRLIHGYDAIDLNMLWDTVEIDLPPLVAALEKILEE